MVNATAAPTPAETTATANPEATKNPVRERVRWRVSAACRWRRLMVAVRVGARVRIPVARVVGHPRVAMSSMMPRRNV
jgi:hypothetical protein